jgi:thiol-disulfide isomerase/thioredoxin
MYKKLCPALVAMMLSLVPHAWSQAAPAAPAAPASTVTPANPAEDCGSDPKLMKALQDAKQERRTRHLPDALDDYKKASKLSGGQCLPAEQGMYDVAMMLGEYKDAIAAATQLRAISTTPATQSRAAWELGGVYTSQGGDKPKPAQLQAAHAAYQEAIALNPRNASAYFADGKTLAWMGKTDEARAEFQQCLSCVSAKDPAYLRAEHFAENPELSMHKMAPPIVVTALDGTQFNLDAMGGRVVLIDFWATWCGPCNEELPHMRKIAKEFAGQPLVIISVSWDKDEQKWKDFIAKNEMTWVQYRDADHKLGDSFEINSIPHYFTIDSDGVLTSEMMGSGSDVEGKLKKLLKKAQQAQAAMSSAPAKIPADGN